MSSIKDSVVNNVGYTTYFCLLGASLYAVYYNDESTEEDEVSDFIVDETAWHYIWALSLAWLGINDFSLWAFRQYRMVKKETDKEREMYKAIANVASLNPRTRRSNSLRRNTDVGKGFIAPALPQHIAFESKRDSIDDDDRESQCATFCKNLSFQPTVGELNINKALRREVLAYTTDGIAQSIDRQAKLSEHYYLKKGKDLKDGPNDSDYPENIDDTDSRTMQRFEINIKHNKHLLYEPEERGLLNAISSDEEPPKSDVEEKPPTPVIVSDASDRDHEAVADDSAKPDNNNLLIQVEMALSEDKDKMDPQRDPNGINGQANILSVQQSLTTPDPSGAVTLSGGGRKSDPASRLQRVSTKLVVDGETDDGEIGTEREFVDMAPLVFKYIRNYVLGISDDCYNKSVIPASKYAQRNILDCKYGEGKSGAFFYFTHDSRYLVKAIQRFEAEVMLN